MFVVFVMFCDVCGVCDVWSFNDICDVFLMFARQIWCGSTRPEQALQTAKSSKHSPGKFRWGWGC